MRQKSRIEGKEACAPKIGASSCDVSNKINKIGHLMALFERLQNGARFVH